MVCIAIVWEQMDSVHLQIEEALGIDSMSITGKRFINLVPVGNSPLSLQIAQICLQFEKIKIKPRTIAKMLLSLVRSGDNHDYCRY